MLILICGVTRSGKTTFSKNFNNVIHLDDFKPTTCYYDILKELKKHSGDVVIDGIYDKAFHRMKLIKSYNTDYYKCIWLNPDEEKIKKRPHYFKIKNFEIPSLTEGWDEIQIIN